MPAEAASNAVTLREEVLVEVMSSGTGRVVWNDRDGTLACNCVAERAVRVCGPDHDDIGGQSIGPPVGLRVGTTLPLCQGQAARCAKTPHYHGDLGVQAAGANTPDPDLQAPPFGTDGVLMGADDGAVDNQAFEGRIVQNGSEYAMPYTLLAPAAEAAERTVPLAEDLRQIAPGRVGAHDRQHTLDNHPVIMAGLCLMIQPNNDQRCHPNPAPRRSTLGDSIRPTPPP